MACSASRLETIVQILCLALWLAACDDNVAIELSVANASVPSATAPQAATEGTNRLTSESGIMNVTVTAPPMAQTGPCFESGCHAELKSGDREYKHKPYVDEQCLDCHTIFHSEETQLRYTQSDIDLCYSCHPQAGLGTTHPVGEGVIDPNTGQMMTCTSTCHQSHSAPYPYLLTLSGTGALCVSCHTEFLSK